MLIGIIVVSFLVACGGGGGGDKSSPSTPADNDSSGKSPSQDIQEKLSYVNGDYEVRGTMTSAILGEKTIDPIKATFKYRLKGDVLEGHPLWENSSWFTRNFSQILSDTRGKLTLHSDGSYSGKRVAKGYHKKSGKLMEITVNENGSFTKKSVQGRTLAVIKDPNSGISGTIEVNYYSIKKTPLYPQAQPAPKPAQQPKPQPQNIQSGLQGECQKIGGTLVPLVIDNTHSYTCSFGNNRPSSFAGFKRVCEGYGLTFKDSGISFMCVGELP